LYDYREEIEGHSRRKEKQHVLHSCFTARLTTRPSRDITPPKSIGRNAALKLAAAGGEGKKLGAMQPKNTEVYKGVVLLPVSKGKIEIER
jgi:hypothetical protein